MQRRQFLLTSAVMSGAALAAGVLLGRPAESAQGKFRVSMTDEEWRRKLTADQYAVLRQEGTERPFTSALLTNPKHGTYVCAGCDTAVYSSDTKFDSGTGWPSFWAAIDGGTATSSDNSLLFTRTEVHCATCGGHLGHIFDDGPKPTGMRHCINGVALGFKEGAASS